MAGVGAVPRPSGPGAPSARTTARTATPGSSFPHDHARSRAYRWNEDGLAGICDTAPAAVPRVRVLERARPDPQGADLRADRATRATTARTPRSTGGTSTPRRRTRGCAGATHYPQAEFPYARPGRRERRRGPAGAPSTSCSTPASSTTTATGTSTSTTRRPRPTTSASGCSVRNAGPDDGGAARAADAVVPQHAGRGRDRVARARAARRRAVARVPPRTRLGRMVAASGDGDAATCSSARTRRTPSGSSATPSGRAVSRRTASTTTWSPAPPPSNPDGIGTKAALWYRLDGAPRARRGGPAAPARRRAGDLASRLGARDVRSARPRPTRSTARSRPPPTRRTRRRVMRQAFAGMLWSKQFYHYDVDRWLDGDPAQPPPPPGRAAGRNARVAPPARPRRHLDARHVGVPVVRGVGPRVPLRGAGARRPGVRQGPADPAVPRVVHAPERRSSPPTSGRSATSTRRCTPGPRCACSSIDGVTRPRLFLERIFHKLLLNFTWWVNRKDADGNNVFEGGFLGLDNIGPFDRSAPLPGGGHAGAVRRHRLDGDVLPQHAGDRARSWPREDPAYEDMATKFFEHFCCIAAAMTPAGLWDEEDGFFYDLLRRQSDGADHAGAGALDGRAHPALRRRRSGTASARRAARASRPASSWFCGNRPRVRRAASHIADPSGDRVAAAVDRLDRSGCGGCSPGCSTRRSSCPRTACGRCRGSTATSRSSSTLDGRVLATVDYEPARVARPACSAGTRTGAGRSGSPSTTS